MSQPSPTQEANQAVSQRALEQIQMRTANGGFGVPPNSELLNRAWAELFQSEMRGRPRKDIYNDVCGLWNDRGWLNDNNKVLLSGHTQKDVTIPKNIRRTPKTQPQSESVKKKRKRLGNNTRETLLLL